jgi:GAF domain-containing protein
MYEGKRSLPIEPTPTMLRNLAAAACTAVTLALLAVQFASMSVDGGVLPTPVTSGSCNLIVNFVPDVVSAPQLDRAARVWLATGSARAGSSFSIPTVRAGHPASIGVTMPKTPGLMYWLIAILSKLIIYGVGALVLWRGRDNAATFFGIASLAISVAIYPTPSSILPPELQVVYVIFARSFADIAALGLFLMVAFLGREALTNNWIGIVRTIVAAGVAVGIADNIFSTIARVNTGCVNSLLAVGHPVVYMAVLAVTLVTLTIAYFRSSGTTRQRLRWIYVSTFVGFTGVLAYLGGQVLNRPIPPYPVMNVTAIAIPIGYAYAILRHRVIDVGFAINRAIVFTAMTTLVVMAFALLSGLLERAAVGPNESVALQVAVALGLALSFNALQKRVESTIDQIFFRRKHHAEAELAQLADEAPFVNSADVLIERVVDTIRRELGADGVAIYRSQADGDYERAQADGAAFPQAVPIDDPAFVRLRTYLRDIDLADVDSAFGKLGSAFPLAVQGRLSGAIICGPRSSEEPYDPDERAAVRALAVRVAAALETLRARELTQLVREIADGSVDASQARARARDLSKNEALGHQQS